MNYAELITKFAVKEKSRIGILGATKGYGYTLLSQVLHSPYIELGAISSRNVDDCVNVLTEVGYPVDRIVICNEVADTKTLKGDEIVVTSNSDVLFASSLTSIVECTGNVELGAKLSEKALQTGMNIYMVSKETDSVCGPYLSQLASEHDTIYSLTNGDQPANLIDLIDWAKALGLEIVCAGKSSEYDFVYDFDSKDLTYTDGSEKYEKIPGLSEQWVYQGTSTLAKRKELLQNYMSSISADLCEMNLVSNITGYKPARKELSYPVARVSELADIFIPEEDGGILKQEQVVDVFYQLREPTEASFAGGVFIIVRCNNEKVWELLRGKGHVVSKSGKYACLYLPYHIMGVETPTTILLGDLCGLGTRKDTKQHTIMAAVAQDSLQAGTILKVSGHHHSIAGTLPILLTQDRAEGVAPFYLLNNATLTEDVQPGEVIPLSKVDIKTQFAYSIFRKGLEK